MKSFAVCLIGLLASVSAASAEEPTVSGQVRLLDGSAVVGAQVVLFDVSDLRRGALVQATTDADGRFALPLASSGGRGLPQGFALGQNYPNPFNPGTVVPYQLAVAGYVRLEVFNLLGQRVATLVDGEQLAGAYAVPWDARDAAGYGVAAGVYIYRLTAGGETATRRMVLVDGSVGFGGSTSTSSAGRVLLDGGRVEAEGSAYGLVVFGGGMVAHVEAGLRVGAGPLVVEVQRAGRGKTTQVRIQLLGDVDNNGQVNIADALLVMAYSLGASLAMPNGGDIALGDVNGDGRVDGEDARLIELYSSDPSFPGLPAGIGKPQSEGDVPRRAITVALAGGEQMEFVWVAPGTFRMGSGGEGWDDERPQHEVMVGEGFYLGRYEVTQGQWAAVMGTTPWAGKSRVRSQPLHPAVYISWEDAQAFVSRLNSAAGETLYRLPTEAEWEYACRAGTAKQWSFADEEGELADYAWYKGNAWGGEEEYARAVGTKLPNPWGLHDMQGNVWEWVQDWYDKSFYHRSPRLNPQGPAVGSGRVLRGGGFGNVAERLRSAYRHSYAPDYRSFDVGMRLLRLAEAESLGGPGPVQGPVEPPVQGPVEPDESSEFNIELVFLDGVTDYQKELAKGAADRWMEVITGDLPGVDYSKNPRDISLEGYKFPLPFTDKITVSKLVDDICIYVRTENDDEGGTLASAYTALLRDSSFLPSVSVITFDLSDIHNRPSTSLELSYHQNIALHEMVHALGFTNTVWREKSLILGATWDSVTDKIFLESNVRFIGPLAILAFNDAGGRDYNPQHKVPVENDADEGTEYSHWRASVFHQDYSGELMIGRIDPWTSMPLSAITIQAFADMGYQVDVSKAEPYTLPTQPSAKPVVAHDLELRNCVLPGPIHVVDANGRVVRTIGE